MKVIQPTGFVTDYYREPTNNITQQSYVPIQPAWVSASGKHLPLPVLDSGYMVADHNGRVFHHSAGMNGTGYAICLSCGRAESMTQTGAYPKILNPEDSHYPPRPSKFDRDEDNKREHCKGHNQIMKETHIGSFSNTDVFELILRHPQRGEYIPDDSRGLTIATTLAVALRAALASVLGVSVNEVEYSTRPATVDDGEKARVLQLFDNVSGGAGFATSAPQHISKVMERMLSLLECDNECEAYCQHCLLEADSRHDIDKLNRKEALAWLGDDFGKRVSLQDKYKNMLQEAQFYPNAVKMHLAEMIRQSPEEIAFVFSDDLALWDTSIQPIKHYLYTLLSADIKVSILVPEQEYSDEIKLFLLQLDGIGVQLKSSVSQPSVVYQVYSRESCITLATPDVSARIPGAHWLESEDISVISCVESRIETSLIDIKAWKEPKYTQGQLVHVMEIKDEFNGSLMTFGSVFWKKVLKKASYIGQLLKEDELVSISYTDRYLKSPSYLLLITEVLSWLHSLNSKRTEKITIDLCLKENRENRQSTMIKHDWFDEKDMVSVITGWIKQRTNIQPDITVHSGVRNVPHQRMLVLGFKSGNSVLIRMDQGVGYWELNASHQLKGFDFNDYPDGQISRLRKLLEHASVKNSADWPTNMSINIIKAGD